MAKTLWAEISSHPHKVRFSTLSRELAKYGLENEIEFIEATNTDRSEIEKVFNDATSRFSQIRVGGLMCELLLTILERMPSGLLTLKATDALVQVREPANEKALDQWWPKNFLAEGLGRALIKDLKTLDLSGAAFLLGGTCEGRGVVASLVRLGFTRFSVSDPDGERGQKFVESIRSSYFGVTFQFVPHHLITQLPSVHSIAVNVLETGADDGALAELFYFNFLKAGGVWLDLAMPGNSELESEARAVGSSIESAFSVAAWTDHIWAKEAFDIDLDVERLAQEYSIAFKA